MDDVVRLKLSPEQLRSLPLGLRTIWVKDLANKSETDGHYFIESYRSVVIVSPPRRPTSRI